MNIWLAVVLSIVLGFIVAFGLGFAVVPWLHKLNFGQTILDIGPSWHKKKQGTPTMGGVLFIVGFVFSFAAVLITDRLLGGNILLFGSDKPQGADTLPIKIFAGIGMALAFGFIGFVDDYIKVVKKRNLGLRAWQKIVLQLAAAAIFVYFEYGRSTQIYLPYVKRYADLGVWFIPFAILVIVATTNAVNLTDGLDGLASGVTTLVALAFSAFCYIVGSYTSSIFAAFIAGSCIGFLFYNHYPARVFMGDTGSLALGGALAGVAITSGLEIVLVIIGGIYVVEALSVILQVFVFKTQNGRRLFRMSPLHHHFELGGWSENTVVLVFCFVTLMLIIIAFPGI